MLLQTKIPKVILFLLVTILSQNLFSQNRLLFDEDTVYFKPLIDGQKVEISYKFKVLGTEKLYIHQIYPGCSCTTPIYSSDTLNGGDSGKITLQFDSKTWGEDGGRLVKKHIYVLYNGGSQVIYFHGDVHSKDSISKIKFDTLVFDLGNIAQNSATKSYKFTFTNYNYNPVMIKNIKFSTFKSNPQWSKELIALNRIGIIEGSYSLGKLGSFNEKIIVETNLGTTFLTLKGTVVSSAIERKQK